MAYKYQYNPGIQDNVSLRSINNHNTNGKGHSRNGTLKRYDVR